MSYEMPQYVEEDPEGVIEPVKKKEKKMVFGYVTRHYFVNGKPENPGYPSVTYHLLEEDISEWCCSRFEDKWHNTGDDIAELGFSFGADNIHDWEIYKYGTYEPVICTAIKDDEEGFNYTPIEYCPFCGAEFKLMGVKKVRVDISTKIYQKTRIVYEEETKATESEMKD